MQTVLSPDQMRRLESRAMAALRINAAELMERAARALVDELRALLIGCEGHTVYFACGPGNNGGDGYAAARLFANEGGKAVVISAGDEARLAGDARANCLRAHQTPRCFFHEVADLAALPPPDVWVDALFGIGLARPLQGHCERLAERMETDRAQGSTVLSVDIPSGLCALTGQVLGAAVRADVTMTFEYLKLGHLLLAGPDWCGDVRVRSIGIEQSLLSGDEAALVSALDVTLAFPRRERNTHKGNYGHLLIVAGSRGMAGACLICAMAAVRSGTGLVTVACPESLLPIVQARVPVAMCAPLPERDGLIAPSAAPMLAKLLEGKSAVAAGPGMGMLQSEELLEPILSSPLPAVLDADALNLIARSAQLRSLLRPHQLITPHPGEAARLLGGPVDSPYGAVLALRALGPTALLKGATTLVAGDRVYLSASGSPGMAKGGSGDALTGIIGALLAQGFDAQSAGYLGSELHGLAGEEAARRYGERGMTAEDLVGCLREAFDGGV